MKQSSPWLQQAAAHAAEELAPAIAASPRYAWLLAFTGNSAAGIEQPGAGVGGGAAGAGAGVVAPRWNRQP
jgi:hypothetical protein